MFGARGEEERGRRRRGGEEKERGADNRSLKLLQVFGDLML